MNVNGTSVLLAGIVNTQNVPLSKLAKWLVAGGTATASNALTVSGENYNTYGTAGHMVDLSDGQEATKFAFNVILGTILDRGREVVTEHGTERLVTAASNATGRAQRAALRWVEAKKVNLGLSYSLGISFESSKKKLENLWDKHNEQVKKEEDAHLARTKTNTQAQSSRQK